MANYGPFSPAQIDFSWLSGLPDQFEKGSLYGRQRKLRNVMGTEEAKAALASGDYGKLASIIGQFDPKLATELAQGGDQRFGMNLVFDDAGNAYQTMGSGGVSPVTPLSGGKKFVAPQTWGQGPGGYVPLSSRGVVGGSGALPVTPVPTQDYSMGPDGTPQPQPQQGGIPSLNSVKQGRELASMQASDRALAQGAIEQFSQIEEQVRGLIDEAGNPTEDVRAISGVYPEGGIGEKGYGIPKASLPNMSQRSLDTTARLKTITVDIGLATLAKMRSESAQGASGMGQLAIAESEWLQQSVRNLQAAQSPEQIAKHSQEVIMWTRRIREIITQKYSSVYGEEPGGPTQTQPPPAAAPSEDVPGAVPMPQIKKGSPEERKLLNWANKAIQAGADQKAVVERLRGLGVGP